MAGLYSYYIAPIVLTPTMVNTPQLVNTGTRLGGWLLIQNNSPYKIQMQLPGSSGNYRPLDPQTVDKLRVEQGDQQIYILPLTLLPGAAPSSQVDIQVYPGDENEPPGTYPMALPRQTAPTSGAAVAGYTAFLLCNVASSLECTLSVFNPSNNTKTFVFYEALLKMTFASGSPTANLGFATTDPNFSTSTAVVNPNTVNASGTGAHVTGKTNSGGATYTTWEPESAVASGIATILIPFPDQKACPPGTGLLLDLFSLPGTGGNGQMVAKYTEQ